MKQRVKNLLFSEILADSGSAKKIAYMAIVTALCVVCNIFFEFKLAETQFSLTLFFSAMAGIIIGPLFGFVACFIGDLVGFLCNSGGFMYMPWIGLAMGMVAFISGAVANGLGLKFKGGSLIKVLIIAVLTFLACTVAINTTAFWILYNNQKVPYTAYLVTRLFVQGQIWNSLLNYALLLVAYPTILKIKQIVNKRKQID